MAISIFIDGEAGTTGLQIGEKLAQIKGVELVSLPAASRKDVDAKRQLLGKVDVTILCLPDEAAREAATLIAAEKDAASHRGRAFRALLPTLAQLLAEGRLG